MLFVFTHCLAHILPTLPPTSRGLLSQCDQAALRTRPLAEPAVTQNADAWLPSWRWRLHVFELGSKAFKKYQCGSFQSSFFAFCITSHACSFLEMAVVFTHKRLVQLEQLGFSRRLTKILAKLAREEIPDADFRYTFATGLRDLNGSISS